MIYIGITGVLFGLNGPFELPQDPDSHSKLIQDHKADFAADSVHVPDFSTDNGGYTVSGSNISIKSDPETKPLTNPSLKISVTKNASGVIKSHPFTITATHGNGWVPVDGKNLAFWNVQYYVKASPDFRGSYHIVARILDNKNYEHPSDPRYNQTGKPFEISFDNYGGEDTFAGGFICKKKPFCAVCTTHPNNRNTYGNNDVEICIYLENATGQLWISDLKIVVSEPHTGDFTNAHWSNFETSDGIHYLSFMCVGQPEYALAKDYCSELIMDTGYKLFRAAGFNQCRTPVSWGDHLSRSEYQIIINNSKPDGSGDYEQSLNVIENYVDRLNYYDISVLILSRGTPDWTHPLHHNNLRDGDHNGFENSGTTNGLGNPYPGPHVMIGNHWMYPPDDWKDYRDYVTALVGRLKSKNVFYEIFNEVNVSTQDCPVGGYKAVTKYVENFSEAANAIDSDVVIITGAMDKMLAGCTADGILNHVSGVGYHGYSGDLSGTRAITQSSGQKKHIWMTEHHGLHQELWSATYEQGCWNTFSLIDWPIKEEYKIVVLEDSEGNRITNKMPSGLGDRVQQVQDYYAFGEMSGALDSSDLSGQGPSRIEAEVICNDKVQYGTNMEVILRASNNTFRTFGNVKLWPVGFVDNLGCSMDMIRSSDRTIEEFAPGHVEEISLVINPTTTKYRAGGAYTIGLVIVNNEHKHSLGLKSIDVIY